MPVIDGKAKIAVVANCQARPVANLIAILAPGVEITTVTIVHLAREADAAEALAHYANSDFLFAQAVQHNYPTPFVRTAGLKEQFGGKVVTWPNIFYQGQCPEIRYMTSGTGRVLGPLGEYQNIAVYEAWRNGFGVAATVDRLLTGGDWVTPLADEAPRSMAELRTREARLDVGIADHIAAHWQARRLFHTFNHPTNELLLQVARDLLVHIGINPDMSRMLTEYPEALDQFVPAMLPPLVERLGLRYRGSTITKGVAVNFADKVTVHGGKRVPYPLQEFVETSFRCLDAQLASSDPVRIT
jgi:hypothetical protein